MSTKQKKKKVQTEKTKSKESSRKADQPAPREVDAQFKAGKDL